MRLSNPGGGAVLGALDTAVLTITDNDVAGAIQFSARSTPSPSRPPWPASIGHSRRAVSPAAPPSTSPRQRARRHRGGGRHRLHGHHDQAHVRRRPDEPDRQRAARPQRRHGGRQQVRHPGAEQPGRRRHAGRAGHRDAQDRRRRVDRAVRLAATYTVARSATATITVERTGAAGKVTVQYSHQQRHGHRRRGLHRQDRCADLRRRASTRRRSRCRRSATPSSTARAR